MKNIYYTQNQPSKEFFWYNSYNIDIVYNYQPYNEHKYIGDKDIRYDRINLAKHKGSLIKVPKMIIKTYREKLQEYGWSLLILKTNAGNVEKLAVRKSNIMVDFFPDIIQTIILNRVFNIHSQKNLMNDINDVLVILELIEKYVTNLQKITEHFSLFDINGIGEINVLLRSIADFNNISDIEKFIDNCDELFDKYDYLINAKNMGLL